VDKSFVIDENAAHRPAEA